MFLCQNVLFFSLVWKKALVLVNLIIRFCQMRQMQHQTEKCLVPEASVLFHVSWAFHSHSRLSLFVWDSWWILHLGSRRQFWNSPLIVANAQIESFCLTLKIWGEWNKSFFLVSPLWWHWTLFPLPADGCCSFYYRGEAGRDFFSCCWFTTD